MMAKSNTDRLKAARAVAGSPLKAVGVRIRRVMQAGVISDFRAMGERMMRPSLLGRILKAGGGAYDEAETKAVGRDNAIEVVGPLIEPAIVAHFRSFVAFEAQVIGRANQAARADVLKAAGVRLSDAPAAFASAALNVIQDLPIPEDVLIWAREFAAQRVTQMDATTRDRLARTIADALGQDQRGVEQIAAAIRAEFVNMSAARAVLIAWTEVGDAMSEGAWAQAREMESQMKEWLTVGDDRVSQEICEPNGMAGEIPFDEEFPSGHMHPLGHPRCRCVVRYSGARRAVIGPRA